MIEELVSEVETISVKMHTYEERSKFEYLEPVGRLRAAAEVAKAWSGSNMGYHSCVYYQDFEVPPPGVHFSSGGVLGRRRSGTSTHTMT